MGGSSRSPAPLVGSDGWTAPWIWTRAAVWPRNAYVRFRRELAFAELHGATIEISADARYWLWINGVLVGFGPPRGWPDHWSYDRYKLTPFLRRGVNVLAVLVNHWRDGNFQYLPAPPGLTARICHPRRGVVDQTGAHWMTAVACAEAACTPRISVQLGFEEQHDGRAEDGWRERGFRDAHWTPAVETAEARRPMGPRDIPYLSGEVVTPQWDGWTEEVRPAANVWNLSLKPAFAPGDRSANFCFVRGFVVSSVHAEEDELVEFIRPHHHAGEFMVGSNRYPAIELPPDRDFSAQPVQLRKGWNRLVFPYPGYRDALAADLPAGGVHLPVFVLSVRARSRLRWDYREGRGGAPWAFAGPFPLDRRQTAMMRAQVDYPRVVQAEAFPPGATRRQARACAVADDRPWREWCEAPWVSPLSADDVRENDVFAQWCGDEVVRRRSRSRRPAKICNREIAPAEDGSDVRVLLDFGRMCVGRLGLEVEAPAGVQFDLHGFEFIQLDGRQNLATGMNNTLRYISRAGRQTFFSLQRRGFRYVSLVVRAMHGRPVRLRRVWGEDSTYPQAARGRFTSSDRKLNAIWRVGAHTLRCCAEDTYTDCPTYEQTHWVGDARNEALVDWVVNGDARLWRHSLLQAGRGLLRLPLIPSHVPSTWENLLPAWSFLWLRSCREYLWWTGDRAGAGELFAWVRRCVAGIEACTDARGLFQLRAWNMFDWAAMETPADAVITHLNCLAALALEEVAQLARWLAHPGEAVRWRLLARRLRAAVNRHLWDPRTRAYADCLYRDGRLGGVRSQQTQVTALLAGVARGRRGGRCREIVSEAPPEFVRAGSPFFVFFQLELLARRGAGAEMTELIRRAWGFMLAEGATTFWELWSLNTGRLTRSHCHGWSSAPTFFLSTAVLGVTPGAPDSRVIRFRPRPGDLRAMSGSVPTPWGWVQVLGRRRARAWRYVLSIPRGCQLQSRLAAADRLELR